jgi:hypothetical protein
MRTLFAHTRIFARGAAFAVCSLAAAGWLFQAGPLAAQTPDDPAPALPPPPSPAPIPIPQFPPGTPAAPNPTPPNLPPGLRQDAVPPDDPNSTVEPNAGAQFVPENGRMGQPVEYRVVITAGQRVFELPLLAPPDGMTLQRSIIPSFQSIPLNGQTVIKSTLRFRVQVEESGSFTIPSFQLKVGNRQVQVPAAQVTMLDRLPGEAASQPVRAILDLPKREFFVGETIQARVLCIDSPDEIATSVSHVAKSGGGILFKPSRRYLKRETFTYEGKPVSGLILPVEISPLVAGDTEVNCQLFVQVQKRDNVGRFAFQPQSPLDTPSVRIKVLPLPQAGRPAGFNGAIGKFTVGQPEISAKEIEVGEPIGIQLELRGKGNVDGVPAPEFPAQADWMAYRPTSNYEADEEGGGTKTYTFTLVPKRAGVKSTPALPFAYFDPEAREFRDISIPPLPITVKAGAAPAPAEVAKGDTAPVIDAPIEVPAVLTGLAEKPGRWLNSPAPALRSFFIAQLAPPCILLALWGWRKRREYLANNPGVIRRRKAHAAAREALATARAAARRNDFPAFLTAGLGALREAAAPLDSAQASSLTREEVLRQLRDDQRAARAADSFFQSAEASRYASEVATDTNAATMLPELEHAVARLSALA